MVQNMLTGLRAKFWWCPATASDEFPSGWYKGKFGLFDPQDGRQQFYYDSHWRMDHLLDEDRFEYQIIGKDPRLPEPASISDMADGILEDAVCSIHQPGFGLTRFGNRRAKGTKSCSKRAQCASFKATAEQLCASGLYRGTAVSLLSEISSGGVRGAISKFSFSEFASVLGPAAMRLGFPNGCFWASSSLSKRRCQTGVIKRSKKIKVTFKKPKISLDVHATCVECARPASQNTDIEQEHNIRSHLVKTTRITVQISFEVKRLGSTLKPWHLAPPR